MSLNIAMLSNVATTSATTAVTPVDSFVENCMECEAYECGYDECLHRKSELGLIGCYEEARRAMRFKISFEEKERSAVMTKLEGKKREVKEIVKKYQLQHLEDK